METIAAHKDLARVFRSADCRLESVPGADNKLELSFVLDHAPLGPKYIVETRTPEKLRIFLK